MLSLDVLVLRGAFPAANRVELSFPLKGSRYSLLEGGDSPITIPSIESVRGGESRSIS